MTDAVASAVLQVAVFTAGPFLVYLATRRRVAGFSRYVGLYRPTGRAMGLAIGLALATGALLALALAVYPDLRDVLGGTGTPAGRLRGSGLTAEAVGLLLVGAVVQTALSEEVLFRGFVAKRLIERLGFTRGNTLHAALFALPHLGLLLVPGAPRPSALGVAGLFAYPFAMGWALASINERVGNGSILPGWAAHALGNATGYALLAF
jgi:membrane protease YdiL (CAAX protease family)